MRRFYLIAAVVVLLAPGLAAAQQATKIEKVRVGFRPYNEAAGFGRYKIGLWTPVYVEITAGDKGLGKRGEAPFLHIETSDFEDVGTIFRTPVPVLEPGETRMVVAYTKTGNSNNDIKVVLEVGNRKYHPPGDRDQPMFLQGHVYLALGRRVADLPAALIDKKDNEKNDNFNNTDIGQWRAALFEDKVDLLPAHWFGYDGVDVIFLSTDNKEFLARLADKEHVDQLRALVQWVRRGGRLVVPVSKHTQLELNNLLNKAVWQPPIPVVPPPQPSEKFVAPERLGGVETWGKVHDFPLPAPGDKPPAVTQIEPANVAAGDWDVEARVGAEGPPLIAKVKYGLGQITYLAFSLDDPAFNQWQGHVAFLREAVHKLAPLTGQDINPQLNQGNFRGRQNSTGDITSQLYNAMDNFDVRVIPFAVVAIFIVLYVVVVGPLEFVLLKYVFGRLEWTWVTFPAVVLGVSVIAYFGAYALKGQDLKVNKVDIIDFDLRTDLDAKHQPRSVRVYGQTFLTILSPRIQSYTVGIEPNPMFWGDARPAKPLSADLVSWMARPDDGPGGMGRGSGQGFFRKPYHYGSQSPNDPPHEETLPSGVTGVPIPVWMAKAFSASYEATASTPPVVAELVYHRNPIDGKEIKVSGTLRSNMPVDLVDTWLFYTDRCYQIESGLPAGDKAGVKISLDFRNNKMPRDWHSDVSVGAVRPNTSQGLYDPNNIVKQILFHEQLDQQHSLANHSLRRLDLSWRLHPEPTRDRIDRSTREAILVARVRFQSGSAEDMTADPGSPLPTNLWLGGLPEMGGSRPTLAGNMNQDTFVRMILPVRPAGN